MNLHPLIPFHQRLENTLPWYKKWHQNPFHKQAHFSILSLFSSLAVAAIIATVGFSNVQTTQASGTFNPLSQTSRWWVGMAAAPNGDVYAGTQNGDIYKQTGGTGNFVALSQTTRIWKSMAATPNGDVYAAVVNGDIYKQTGGTGNFVALSQATRNWQGMAAAPNGDVYAAVANGDIYKQTGGTGNFVALSQTTRVWLGMAAAPNGDVYAGVHTGDIYKQTGGTGNFVALSQTTRIWRTMAAAPNGDVYAAVDNGDIYKQTGGTGNFVALSQTTRDWDGMAVAPNGDVYAASWSFFGHGDIYKQSAPVAADTTAPTFSSSSINSAGTTFTVNWTEVGSPPVTGTTGLSLAGLAHGAATLSSVSTTGLVTTATISRSIYSDETPTLSYTAGNFADSATSPNAVANFSGQAITNSSSQTYVAPDTTAPTFSSSSINSAGTTLTVNWTEVGSPPVTGTTGLSLAGLTHGAATLSSVSTTGLVTTATISRSIYSDETPTLSYTAGNFADSATSPNAVANFSGQAITNSSSQTYVAPDTTSPALPTSISAQPGDTTVTISWTNPGDADFSHINLYRSTTSGVEGAKIGESADASATTYTDATVNNGITYYYTLKSVDEIDNESSGTSQVSANPLELLLDLDAPTGGEYWRGGSTQNITWTASGNGIASIALFYSSDGGSSYPNTIATGIATGETNDGTYSWTVDSLNSSLIRVLIQSRDGEGNILATDFSASNFTIDSTAPNFTSASVLSSGTELTINLTEALSSPLLPASGITGFSVLIDGDSVSITSASRQDSLAISLLLGETIYEGQIVTLSYSAGNVTDSAGNPLGTISNASVGNNSTVQVPDTDAPEFTITSATSNNADSSRGTSGNLVTVVFTANEELLANPTVTLGGQAMTFSNKTGLAYTYTRTLDGTETEGTSPIVISGSDLSSNPGTGNGNFLTDFTAPSTPTGTTATRTNDFGAITTSWNNPADSDLSSVTLYRSAVNGFTPGAGNLLYTGTATSHTETGLAHATPYYYRLIATDTTGNTSAASSQFSATTHIHASQTLISLPGQSFTPGFGVTGTATAQTAGASFMATVHVADSGNNLSEYPANIALTSSDIQAVLPVAQTNSSGSTQFTVTLKTAGSPNITANASGVGNETVLVSVNPGSVSASTSSLVAGATTLTVGQSTTLTATVKDDFGNTISGKTAALSTSGSDTLTQPSTTTNGSGVTTGSTTASAAGTSTITLTVDSISLATVNITWNTASISPTPTPTPNPTTTPDEGGTQAGTSSPTASPTTASTSQPNQGSLTPSTSEPDETASPNPEVSPTSTPEGEKSLATSTPKPIATEKPNDLNEETDSFPLSWPQAAGAGTAIIILGFIGRWLFRRII